jgi:hypothetical protein
MDLRSGDTASPLLLIRLLQQTAPDRQILRPVTRTRTTARSLLRQPDKQKSSRRPLLLVHEQDYDKPRQQDPKSGVRCHSFVLLLSFCTKDFISANKEWRRRRWGPSADEARRRQRSVQFFLVALSTAGMYAQLLFGLFGERVMLTCKPSRFTAVICCYRRPYHLRAAAAIPSGAAIVLPVLRGHVSSILFSSLMSPMRKSAFESHGLWNRCQGRWGLRETVF